MATLDELLAKDGFERRRDKPRGGTTGSSATNVSSSRPDSSGSKLRPARTRSDVNTRRDKPKAWPRGGTAGSSATSLSSSQLGSFGSKLRPARTRSDVNPRRSVSVVLEKPGFEQPIPSNVAGRGFRSVDRYEEQSLKLQDPKGREFSSLNESEEVDGSCGKNHRRASSIETSNVKSISPIVDESKASYSNEPQTKLRYNRSSKNNLSDINPWRSLSMVLEKAGSKQPIQNNVAGRRFRYVDRYEEQSLKLHDPKGRAFSSLNESKEIDGSSGKNHWRASSIEASNVSSKSSIEGGYSNDRQAKLRYNRSSKNNLCENEEPKAMKIQNSQVNPSFKDARVGHPMPALDNSALKAITSMLSSCVYQILKDETFRSSLYQACVFSLKSTGEQYRQSKENGVISVLAEAMKAVERIITEGPNQFDLKKAFVNLNVITGLKSMESDDGHTCGIPSSHLAACGHLYLSILYKFQKEDKVSAKHLLQVFCDSPYHARTTLLPELWDCLFLPNLSHLMAWHEKEASSISVTSGVMMQLEFLEKVYNDVVDMVTSQFAAYYKGWLMGDSKGSALPSIGTPSASVSDIAEDANEVVSFKSLSLSNSAPSKTMISKRLYSVLSQAKRNKAADDMESREEEEKDEVGDETEESKADFWRSKCDDHLKKDNENESRPTESGTCATKYFQEYYNTCFQHSVSYFEEINQINENYCCSSNSGILEAEEIKLRSKMVADHSDDSNTYTPKLSIDSPKFYSDQDEMTELTCTKLVLDETDAINELLGSRALKETSSDIVLGHLEGNYQDSLLSRIPIEFICPLTGQLLMDPVTLESGHTFELVAIKDWFNQGNRTCPVTGQTLKSSLIPGTNTVLKHVIKEWVAECFRNSISLASQSTSSPLKQVHNYKFELSLLIIEQILSGFSLKEGKENIEHLISLGGLQFLIKMFEVGCLEEKSRAAELLTKCIEADGCFRNHLAMKISKSSLLNLIHSKQVHARTRAASLLIELICLNRRMDITSFVSGLKTEDIGNTKCELLLCLQSSLPEERVLVAVLLLHLDLMEEYWMHSVYKDEAIKCIVKALECCLFNQIFITNCRRALLMLGGHFSFSGEIMTETWLLKKAGYNCKTYNDEDDQTISEEESRMKEDWLKSMALILLHYGKKSFLETLSKCWKFGGSDLVRVCVVTTAWLSHALASLSVPALQLSAFSAFMPRLKECLKTDLDIELKVLASLSLHNFSKILECRIPLIAFADEIHDPLKSLREVTWTAKHLYDDIFEETS